MGRRKQKRGEEYISRGNKQANYIGKKGKNKNDNLLTMEQDIRKENIRNKCKNLKKLTEWFKPSCTLGSDKNGIIVNDM